jgi:hypothetical protein
MSILVRQQQAADQRTASRDIGGFNVFVNGVSAIAANSQTVEHGDSERREEVSV